MGIASRRVRVPLSRELGALARTLRSSAPYLVVAIALLAVGLAYQVRVGYTLQVGGRTDAPYWMGMNGGEQDPQSRETYRWTGPAGTLRLPGIGPGAYRVRLELNGARPAGYPPPDLVVEGPPGPSGGDPARVLAHFTPDPARRTYEIPVPADATAGGDLGLTLRTTNSFSPRGDPRHLGVTLYRVTVLPEGGGPGLPPVGTWLLLAGGAGLVALLLGVAGWGQAAVRAGGLAWVLGETGFLLFDRLWLTSFAATLAGVLAGGVAILLLLGPLWRALYHAGGIAWPEIDQRWLLAIYGLAFVARLAGQLHPQTVVIDLIFHQHQLEKVLDGQLYFTIPSDEWGGRQTFYLPTPYLFMLPLQWLLNNELLTIRLFTVALDTANVFLVYYLAKRAFADGRAGLLAAGLQVTLPIAVLPFSWGITANLFGQFTGLAAVALAVGVYERLTRPGPWLLATGVFTAALLSHPGSVQLTGLLISGLLLVWGLGAGGWGLGKRAGGARRPRPAAPWLALAAAFVAAGLIAVFAYYAHFAESQLRELAALRAARAAEQAGKGFTMQVGGEVNDPALGLVQRIVHDRTTWLVEGLRGYGAEAWAYFHSWPLLMAAVGLLAARRPAAAPRLPAEAPPADPAVLPVAPARRRMLLAALVWTGVILLYAAVGLLANLYVRYTLFALPLVALGAGLLLSAVARRGRLGRLLVTLVMLGFTVDALTFWYMRITFANK